MKFGFVTCVQLGLSCMEAIYEAGGELALALTLRDDAAKKKSGRVFLDDFCEKKHIPLLKVAHINDQTSVEEVRKADLDWLFIIGWSQIAGAALLGAPRKGVLGIHPTLLPVGRGRAAIPWAILKGLDKTGVTLFKLDEGVDTGPILNQLTIVMTPETTATELYADVDKAHVSLIKNTIPLLLNDTIMLREQDDAQASVWPGRKPEDGLIDLQGSVVAAERLTRAVTRPYPGAFIFEDGRKLVIWKASIVDETTESGKYLKFHDGVLHLDEWEFAEAV